MTQIPDAAVQALEALRKAEMFIENGVEYGFIRLPEKPDPALDTLPKIKAAIEALTNDDAKTVDVAAVLEVPVNIDKLIAELKSSEDICFSWARSALLANELNALDTEEAHIDLYQALCRLGNVMAYVQSELRSLSAEPAQGEP